MHIKTQALIIREVEYKEADTILTMLTPEHGRISAKARAVRRKNSPLSAACQLFAWGEFTIFEQRGYMTINEAHPLELFVGLRNDAVRISLAAFIADVLDSLSDSDQTIHDLLRLGLNCFHALSTRQEIHPELVRGAFTFKALSLAGFEPHVDGCAACGATGGDMLFSVADGAVVCSDCRYDDPSGVALPLSGSMANALRQIVLGSDRRILALSLSPAETAALAGLSNTYLLAQCEHGFKTLEFYKTMLNAQ